MKTSTVDYSSSSTLPVLVLISLLCFHATPLSVAGDTNSSNSNDSSGELQHSTLNPSIGVVIVVLLCAFFMTGCIATYIGGCGAGAIAAPSYGRLLIPAVSQQGCRRAKAGLDRSEIESFPTFVYSDVRKLNIGKRALECAVCLAEFKDDESLRLLPKCEHAFHPECIDPWLSVRSGCPLCRSDLVPIAAGNELTGRLTRSVDGGDETDEESNPRGLAEEMVVKTNPGRETRFVRSNSTGHSLIVSDRFRLRLPEEMRRQILVEANMRRAKSFGTLPRVPSSRKGYRSGGEESNIQSGRFLQWTGLVKSGDRETTGTSSDAILVAILVN